MLVRPGIRPRRGVGRVGIDLKPNCLRVESHLLGLGLDGLVRFVGPGLGAVTWRCGVARAEIESGEAPVQAHVPLQVPPVIGRMCSLSVDHHGGRLAARRSSWPGRQRIE